MSFIQLFIQELKARVDTAPQPNRKVALISPSQSSRGQDMPHDFETLIKEGFKGNGLVYACMRQNATSVKEPPFRLIKKDGSEVEGNPISKLLSRPNPYRSREQVIEKLQYHLDGTGTAYLHKVRSGSGQVVELWNRKPNDVRPIADSKEYISGWEIRVGGIWYPCPAEDMIQFLYTDPANDYYGFPPLLAASMAVDADNETDKYIKYLLANMAVVSGIFSIGENLTDDEFKRAKQEMTAMWSGAVNAGLPGLLEGGATWTKMGLSLNELDFGNLWPRLETRVCMAFSIPPIIVGSKAGMDAATYSNYAQAKESYYDEMVVPECAMIGNTLAHSLFPDFGLNSDEYSIVPNFDDVKALQEDIDKKYERAVKGKGYLLVNEQRELVGKEAIEGGNVVYMPMNEIPVMGDDFEEIDTEPVGEPDNKPGKAVAEKAQYKQMSPEDWERAYANGTPHWALDMDPSRFAQQFAEKILSEIDDEIKPKVLEIGCGNGRDSIFFANAGLDVVAIDVSPSAIKLAKENIENADVKVEVLEANAEELSFDNESFDAVFSLSVLHSSDLSKSIPEIARVLKANGLLMLYIYGNTEHIGGEIEEYITVDSFIDLLKSNNYEIEDFYTLDEEEYDSYGEKHLIIVVIGRKI